MSAPEEARAGMSVAEKVIYILRRSFHETPNDRAMAHIARTIVEAVQEPSTDNEREALRGVGAVMRDHEPHWNLGKCRCGARLGDSIDWNWHLANQATLAAARLGRRRPITDERVEYMRVALNEADIDYSAREQRADAGGGDMEPGDWFTFMARAALESAEATE